MKLIPVADREDAAQILWDLLSERTPEQSISHKAMPTWEEHLEFIGKKPGPFGSGRSHPYEIWYLIQNAAGVVGAIYLTHQNEIGLSIFREFQRHGFGSRAVKLLMDKHGNRAYKANVNPANVASIRMWEKVGFKLIQNTYELCA